MTVSSLRVLIGSAALTERGYELGREPRDRDYFAPGREAGEDRFYHPLLEEWSWGAVATLDELYTIKLSHSFWDVRGGSWEKHVRDVIWFQQKTSAKLIPELYSLLYRVWEDTHGPKPANLEKSADEFFADAVQRKYEHDSIHAAVAYGDEPLFRRILKPGHDVAVSESAFRALSSTEKQQLVREELYATAIERVLIPRRGVHPAQAYRTVFKGLVTSFSKGWFPLYVMLHVGELISPDVDYVARFRANRERLVRLP